MIKLNDIVDIYGNNLTKTGKRRRKGGRVWAKEVVNYFCEKLNFIDAVGHAQSPNNKDVSIWSGAGRITFLVADENGGWELTVDMYDSELVNIDEQNGLIILKDVLAIKI